MALTADEVATRRPVWVAMSDLFLDTDVRIWYAITARNCALSPYSESQLTGIFKNEVAPALQSNLLSIAGEWAGFDSDWVVETILSGLEKRWRMPAIAEPTDDWASIAHLVGQIRKLPSSEWDRRRDAWEQLSRFFLDQNPKVALPAREWTVEELDAIWREDVWPAYSGRIEAYWKFDPKLYPDAWAIEGRWQSWRSRE